MRQRQQRKRQSKEEEGGIKERTGKERRERYIICHFCLHKQGTTVKERAHPIKVLVIYEASVLLYTIRGGRRWAEGGMDEGAGRRGRERDGGGRRMAYVTGIRASAFIRRWRLTKGSPD